MSRHIQSSEWDPGAGWLTISADNDTGFTLWFTGLPGTGRAHLSHMVKQALEARGYKVEMLDSSTLPYWLEHELHIEDSGYTPGYDDFITSLCTLLAHNGIITIAVSPYQEARTHAREGIQHFIEVYLHCPAELRRKRLEQQAQQEKQEPPADNVEQAYTPSLNTELSIDTQLEVLERSALRILSHLEQSGRIVPIWQSPNTPGPDAEEIELIKVRLQILGYLE